MSATELNPRELCEKAGIRPNQSITKFVMEDVAAVLIDAGWEESNICATLRKIRPSKLANALLGASWWQDIFEIYAYDINAGYADD